MEGLFDVVYLSTLSFVPTEPREYTYSSCHLCCVVYMFTMVFVYGKHIHGCVSIVGMECFMHAIVMKVSVSKHIAPTS